MMKTKSSKKKIALLAFIVVALVVVGVLVMPKPKPAYAMHPSLDVHFNIVWQDVDLAYDANVTVKLYDVNWNLLTGWSSPLTPDEGYVNWTTEFADIPDEAVNYKIRWDLEGFEWVADPMPINGNINWNNALIDRTTHCNMP
jgi:hypothetical protein